MQKINISNLEQFSLRKLSIDDKILLLRELGFDSDGSFVLNKEGEQITDKYLGIPIKIENMLILPGSTIILDDNELSITLYLREYGDEL